MKQFQCSTSGARVRRKTETGAKRRKSRTREHMVLTLRLFWRAREGDARRWRASIADRAEGENFFSSGKDGRSHPAHRPLGW